MLIEQMLATFTSHDFILSLARQYQMLYVEALYTYRNVPTRQNPAPFQIVHGILAKHLNAHSSLVEYAGQTPSKDIFGEANMCALWRKI